MSVSLVLVPVAFAAIAAWQAAHPEEQSAADGLVVQHVQTRMRDENLLASALSDTHAVVSRLDGAIAAEWTNVRAEFHRDETGIWQVNFTGDVDAARASAIVAAIDAAYGAQVQREVLARLRDRAPEAGMFVESETLEDDQSVTLVLGQGA